MLKHIYFYLFLILPGIIHSQETFGDNSFYLFVNYPVPQSQNSFKHLWTGVTDINVSYSRRLFDNFEAGLGFSYSRFKVKEKFNLATHGDYYTPALSFKYNISLLQEKVFVYPAIYIGYSLTSYRNPDFDETNNESAMSIQPALGLSYRLNNSLSLQAITSYRIIFEHFQDNNLPEDGTVRHVNYGLGLQYNWN